VAKVEPLSVAERARVLGLYEADVKIADIVSAVGRSRSTVYGVLRTAGAKRRDAAVATSCGPCEVCGRPIRYVPPSLRAQGVGRYCSRSCMGAAKRLPGCRTATMAQNLLCTRCRQTKPVAEFYPIPMDPLRGGDSTGARRAVRKSGPSARASRRAACPSASGSFRPTTASAWLNTTLSTGNTRAAVRSAGSARSRGSLAAESRDATDSWWLIMTTVRAGCVDCCVSAATLPSAIFVMIRRSCWRRLPICGQPGTRTPHSPKRRQCAGYGTIGMHDDQGPSPGLNAAKKLDIILIASL